MTNFLLLLSLDFLNSFYFKNSFRFIFKITQKVQTDILCPLFPHPGFPINMLHSCGISSWWATNDILLLSKVHTVHFCLVLSVGFDKCMSSIHHYGVIWNSYTAFAPPIHSSTHFPTIPPSETLANNDLFTVSVILPFPECQLESYT